MWNDKWFTCSTHRLTYYLLVYLLGNLSFGHLQPSIITTTVQGVGFLLDLDFLARLLILVDL